MASNIRQSEPNLATNDGMRALQLASYMREVERLRWDVSAAIWESHEQDWGEHPDTAALMRVRTQLLELGAALANTARRFHDATGQQVPLPPWTRGAGNDGWNHRLAEHVQSLTALNLSIGGLLNVTGQEAYPDPDGLNQVHLHADAAAEALKLEMLGLDRALDAAIDNATHGGLTSQPK